MALVSLATVKSILGISGSSEDTVLGLLKDGVEAAFKRITGRDFEAATYTEYLAGNWTPFISVRETPLRAITTVHFDHLREFGSDTLLTADEDYRLVIDRPDGFGYAGRIERLGGVWYGAWERPFDLIGRRRIPALNVVKAVYSGGYVTIPSDIQNAIAEGVAVARQAAAAGRLVTSQSGEGHSVSYAGLDAELLRVGSIREVIGGYRRVVI